jgi:hypothetical protein
MNASFLLALLGEPWRRGRNCAKLVMELKS